jgi:hypothetical protein
MVLKHVVAAAIGATLLAWGSLAPAAGEYRAEQYRADEFLGLDLSKAVLSPKPLGPATQFAPLRTLAKSDPESPATPARPNSKAAATAAVRKAIIAHPVVKKPHGVSRIAQTRHHGNPLDAQASDTRIQVWPCRSGGICNWQHP